MDIFDIPDDYKPEKPLSEAEMQDITDYLTNHPLFMKDLPEDVNTNPHLAALQNVIYDEDPVVVAESLNRQGNERLAINPEHPFYMKEAYKKYTEGINLKCTDNDINAKLRTNRALLNMKLRNYGKVVEDTQQAIKFNPNYVKAYYRCAQALNKLGKYEEALTILKDRKEPELLPLFQEASEGKTKNTQQAQEKSNMVEWKLTSIANYCKERGWRMKKRTQPIPGDLKVHFLDDILVIPMLILYPQFNQYDVVQKVTQTTNLNSQVSQIVTDLPWDVQHVYSPSSINLYVQVSPHTMLKLSSSTTVDALLKRYEFPEAVEVNVVSAKSKYYQIFLKDNKIIE